MGAALQIRDVPEAVRDELAELASRRGQSMQAYLLALVERDVQLRPRADMFFGVADPHRSREDRVRPVIEPGTDR